MVHRTGRGMAAENSATPCSGSLLRVALESVVSGLGAADVLAVYHVLPRVLC